MAHDLTVLDREAAHLRPLYSSFLGQRSHEILLTAHSHQAWPDASLTGQIEAWQDAARLVDRKWDRVFGEVLPEFQQLVAKRLGSTRPGDLAVAPNTHELVLRLATCFPENATVVTTDSEFHSLRRQLARLAEDGLRVIEVPVEAPSFAERFVSAVRTSNASWAAFSHVLFTNSRLMTEAEQILAALAEHEVPVLVDAYHAFNVVQMEVDRWPGQVFVTAGGYKYAQMGEGTCFMLLPEHAERFRPRSTGWFADFKGLESLEQKVSYGPGGQRFFGATLDPTGLYRGVHVLRWMDAIGLTPAELRRRSLARTHAILRFFDEHDLGHRGLELATPRAEPQRGGFIALRTPRAGELSARLAEAGVRTDHRGALLRLGPAPYTSGAEIETAMQRLASLL